MPFNLYDRVKQKTTTSGSGSITFTSSVSAFVDFSGVYADGDQLFYTIENLTDFEVGIGTYSGNTLSRDTILKSSNSDSILNLPGDSNTFVFATYSASGAVSTTGDRILQNIDGADFNVGVAPAWKEGRIYYDDESKAFSAYNDESEITLQIGQETYARIRNNTTGLIANGEVVYINGSQGTHPTVKKARADVNETSHVVGVATHDIETNSFGYITIYGVVNNVDTSDFGQGDEIYLSPAISGGYTGVPPTAPFYQYSIGHVIRSHPNNGSIFVTPPSQPKLGGGDVKSLGNFQQSGIAFIDIIAGSDAAIISSSTGLSYNSGTNTLQVDAGGVRFPDGVTQTIAYTGQDAYNYWELQVGSDIDTITSTERVQFTGEGLVSVAYDLAKNTVTISGSEGAATGLSDSIYIDLNNQLSGSGSFKYSGDTAAIDATLTAAAISGQGATTSISDADNFIIERGAALRKVTRGVVVTGLATTGELDSVSGYLQGQIGGGGTIYGPKSGLLYFGETNQPTGVTGLIYDEFLGRMALNTLPEAGFHIYNQTSAYPVLQVDAGVGQALPLTRWKDENGIVVAEIDHISGTFSNSGGITYPDGNTQVIAYSGLNINVTGNTVNIGNNSYLNFVGIGGTDLLFDESNNILYISGVGTYTASDGVVLNGDNFLLGGTGQLNRLILESAFSGNTPLDLVGTTTQTGDLVKIINGVAQRGAIDNVGRLVYDSNTILTNARTKGFGVFSKGPAIYDQTGNIVYYASRNDGTSDNSTYLNTYNLKLFGDTSAGKTVLSSANQSLGVPQNGLAIYESDGTTLSELKLGFANVQIQDSGVGVSVIASAGQTGNMQEWKNEIGNGAYVDNSGDIVFQSYSTANRPTAGTPGRVIFNTNDGNLNIDNGSNWVLPNGTIST